MALSTPDIKADLYVNDTCDGLLFQDTTGSYNAVTNPNGWGLPDGPATTDVTECVLTLVNETDDTNLVYTFTVSSGTITAATLSVNGAATVNILTELDSTVFPFVAANPFNLTQDYGADAYTVEDGVYRLFYQVTGSATGGSGTPEDFDYTAQDEVVVNCNVCCCISKLFQSIDADCGCSDKTWLKAMRGYAYMKAAQYVTEATGDVDKAVANLNKAQEICSGNCGCN